MRGLGRSLSYLSEAAYRSLEAADHWLGLPDKMSETLQYRQSWRQYKGQSFSSADKKLWIHGASLGELEDLAAFFTEADLLRIAGFKFKDVMLTSSSPSALSALQRWEQQLGLAYAGPLPPEKRSEMNAFLSGLKIETFILSHSDLWPLLFEELSNFVPHVLWLPSRPTTERSLLQKICIDPQKTFIGSRSHEMGRGLEMIWKGYPQAFVGNTRLDRILSRIDRHRNRPHSEASHVLEKFGAAPDPQRLSILGASFWPEDAAVLAEGFKRLSPQEQARFQIVVIPHECKDSHIVASIQSHLPMARVLAVEGLLVEAFERFACAFVGGAFGRGLHNILEPALWGLPILCGPKLKKQPEALRLLQGGQLFSKQSGLEVSVWIKDFIDPIQRNRRQCRAKLGAEELTSERGASSRLAEIVKGLREQP